MSYSAASPAQRSGRSINDLPTELKKRIVELAAQQDEAYEEWTTGLQPRLEERVQLALDDQKRRYKSSLGALFCVSKQWSELAAPLRFKYLKATRASLKYQILVLHHKAFTSGPHDGGRFRLWHFNSPQTVHSHLLNNLHRLSTSVGTVHLCHFTNVELRLLLKQWPALRTLHLRTTRLAVLIEPSKLAQGLSAATGLAELSFNIEPEDASEDGVAVDISPLVDAVASLPLPPLHTLALAVPLLHPSSLGFSQLFSATLGTLTLTATADSTENDDYIEPTFDDVVFPLLERLSIEGYWIYETVGQLKGRRFPALLHLEVTGLSYMDVRLEELNLATLLLDLPLLRTLRVHHYRRLHPRTAAKLADLTSSRNVLPLDHPPWTSCPEAPFSVSYLAGHSDEVTVNSGVTFVRRLRDYLSNELDRTAKIGDQAALLPLAEALKPLELERLARTG